MLAQKLLSGGAGEEKLYVDDVFSAYTYIGNGSTQTINNGIDLAGKGGLVWQKNRGLSASHFLVDTVRGVENGLSTNSTNGQSTYSGLLTSFASNGFNLGAYNNNSLQTYVSWTFRKAPKFFDVVTWGGAPSNRTISHSLGVTPGFIIIKATNTTSDWYTYHRNFPTSSVSLNSTAAASGTYYVDTVTDTSFNVYLDNNNYVAYLFAHDTSTDGLIQCGSFTTNGSGNATVSLGWEPQYLLVKRTDSATSGNWFTLDTMRGWSLAGDGDNWLYANTPTAENGGGSGANYFDPTATGFKATSFVVSGTFIYMAIRRPNKPPTVGAQVYKGLLHSATQLQVSKTGVGFAPDVLLSSARSQSHGNAIQDRLRGATRNLLTHSSSAEVTTTQAVLSFDIDGVTLGSDDLHQFNYGGTYVEHFFKRAPGVFDIVCYTGTGVAKNEAHNLGVVPELIIVKSRTNAATQWYVYCASLGAGQMLLLNSTLAAQADTMAFNTHASTYFGVKTLTGTNESAATLVAYLFATKAGISKVGNYTGNGSTQVINCGFTTGARFILIKRTDATGDWFVFDTVRGVVAGNDPHISLNTTVAEVTSDDSIDPVNEGFVINNVSPTFINVSAAQYVYLAIS